MRDPIVGNRFAGALLALVLALGFTGTAAAAEFWLQAETLTKTMPDTAVITMWGFAKCTANHASCEPATVPGPRLVVPAGDTTLRVHLKNNLTGPFTEPVSIVIPGQIAAMSPVWIDTTGSVVSQGSRPPGDVTSRMRSFTSETAVGATVNYTWTNLKPGTYLYHSGTHPAVQVQMGLYGAITHDAAALIAYSGVPYGNEVVLLFSEIDPVLHAHVAAGTYGTPPPAGITSTIDFHPKYFLINGEPFTAGRPAISAGQSGHSTLIRFLNGGLRDYAPVLQGLHMSVLAENGNLFPHEKIQYSLLLSAGKTADALITPAAGGTVPIYDRRLALSNNANSPGGAMVFLSVMPGVRDLVVHYYNTILGRAPEPGGAEFWIAEIDRIVSLGISINEGFIAVAKAFFNSSEYVSMGRSNTAFVGDLYNAFLNRAPAQSEVDFWVGYLTQGLSRSYVISAFAFSAEYRAYLEGIFGVSTARPENNLVNDFYRGFLSRLPETAGFNGWLTQMRAAQCAGAAQVRDLSHQIALGFIQSAEYVARNRTNGQYVGDLYDAILRRDATLADVNSWVNLLNTGATRAQVLQSFTNSPEFQGRVQNVINAGCLP